MGNELIIEGQFTKLASESWKSRLAIAKENLAKRTIPAFIEFCQEVHAFRLDCDSSQGGSEFSRKGTEWLGCSSSQLNYWDAVGRRAPELSSATGKLPTSEFSISQIASLDDQSFQKAMPQIRPEMTQKQVRELIKDISPPRQSNVSDEDRDRSARERLFKAFMSLSEKSQFVFGRQVISHYREKGWKMP